MSQYKWHLVAPGKLYAGRKEGGKTICMHREMMQPPPGVMVEHIDGNGLHNRRANMRNCTNQQNMQNIHKRRSGSSVYKGVHYDRRRRTWYARICHSGKNINLGTFATEIEAARAYDRAARQLFGEFAHLNFPEESPHERRELVVAKCDASDAVSIQHHPSENTGAGFILRTGSGTAAKPFVGIPEFLPQFGFDIAAKVEDSLSALP